jgi:Phage integrase, N-terminal SAM-like domain
MSILEFPAPAAEPGGERVAVAVDRYLDSLQTKTTRDSYGETLTRLSALAGHRATAALTPQDYTAVMDRWAGAAAATWNRHLSALTSFTTWAGRQEILATNPARRLQRRKPARRGDRAIPRTRLDKLFIPEGAGPCQGGSDLAVSAWAGAGGACVTGVSCFPVAARSAASGRAGQGPGAARPRSGAGGVLEVPAREPDNRAGGEREPSGGGGGYSVVSGRPMFRVIRCAGSAAGCIHPFAWPRPGPGGHGAGPRQGAVRRGQSQERPAAVSAGGRIACGLAPGGGQNAWRPRACARGG